MTSVRKMHESLHDKVYNAPFITIRISPDSNHE